MCPVLAVTGLILALNGDVVAAPTLKIEGGGSIQKGKSLTLRVKKQGEASEIRWYQIIPDVSHYYKNANHPWEENPYKWVGFGKIDYERREIVAGRGKWELTLFDPKDKQSAPLKPSKPADKFRRDVGSF